MVGVMMGMGKGVIGELGWCLWRGKGWGIGDGDEGDRRAIVVIE